MLHVKEGEKKFGKVMHEWGQGDLKSSSGKPVADQKQALAIAFSEMRRKLRQNDEKKG
jgi:hypothetical protein